MSCPDVDLLLDFLAERLDWSRGAAVRTHVQQCASCRVVIASQRELCPEAAPEPPQRVGRFELTEVLGEGSAGRVYAARDPQLDRQVAVKLLRASVATTPEQRALLIREAQVMAKVRHQNVVTVHDAGVEDECVYLVMELVEGTPLGTWLRAERPDPAAIVACFADAGDGLAAAHRAGIVHRDFKPANVFVGADGAVRVGDFGLARIDAPDTAADAIVLDVVDLESSVSVAGRLIGTPAYMSPEQLVGETATARSDQYSFCVALYEALTGSRPFVGDSLAQLRALVRAGQLPQASPRHLDAHVWTCLRRGLSVDPALRFDSMEALIAQLRRDRAGERRRRLVQVGVAAVLVALAGAVLVMATRTGPQLCAGADAKLDGVWDRGVRGRVSARFAALAGDGGAASAQRLLDALDRYTGEWVAMRRDACEDTRVRGDQSERVMQLRVDCLDRRLSEVRELSLVVLQADHARVLDRAVKAASELTALDACEHIERLAEATPLPEDAATRGRVVALRGQLDRASALLWTGQYERSRQMAERLAADAVAIGYAPLEAEAWYLLGRGQAHLDRPAEAEASLRAGIRAGSRAKDDVLVADAWVRLLRVIGLGQSRTASALALRESAEAAIERAGGDPRLRAELVTVLGDFAAVEGEAPRARELHSEALRIFEQAGGPMSLDVANVLLALADDADALGKYEDAGRLLARGLAIRRTRLGPEHPDVGIVLMELGSNQAQLGNDEEAETLFFQALAITERELGPNHRSIATLLNSLGDVQGKLGKFAEAEASLRRALQIYQDNGANSDPSVGAPLNGLAVLLLRQHKRREALPFLEQALDVFDRQWPDGHPKTAMIEINLGLLYGGLAEYEPSLRHCRRALELGDEFLGQDSQLRIPAMNCIGTGQVRLGQYAEARRIFEQTLALDAKHPVLLAELRFGLAQTLVRTGGSTSRATVLATQAREVFASGGEQMADSLEEVDDWLGGKR